MGVESSSLDLPPNRVHGYGVRNDFVCDLNDGEYHEYSDHDEQSANATLIALAPEMAEAILGFQYAGEGCLCVDHGILPLSGKRCEGCVAVDALHDLADRLLSIASDACPTGEAVGHD